MNTINHFTLTLFYYDLLFLHKTTLKDTQNMVTTKLESVRIVHC